MRGDHALFFGLWPLKPLQIAAIIRLGIERLCAVVSSLPVKWFTVSAQRAVVGPCLGWLGPGGAFLQMTNAFASPIAIEPLGIAGERIAHVWRNLPPAQIWTYSTLADANAREMQ